MKVGIYETVEVEPKQRVRIASVLDKKTSKRVATRDELKSFIWHEGDEWEMALADQYAKLSNNEPEIDEDIIAAEDLEDLI